MLSALSVKNIVLIDHLDIDFGRGLTVLTGETGAGKSILLDALTLAMGGRGNQSLVRMGTDSGQITVELNLPFEHPSRVLLRENEISDEETLLLRRIQYADGRTRAFINDQAVSAALLRRVGSSIIEIHGQHDERALIESSTHRAVLDLYGGLNAQVGKLADVHEVLVTARAAVESQKATIANAAEDEEYARHVVDELSQLNVEVGEEEALAERRQHLMNLEKSADEVRDADEILSGSSAPGPALAALMRRLSRKSDGEADLFAPVLEALDASLVAIDQAGDALENLKREMAYDPGELEGAEERLFALRATARKHQVSCDQLPAVLEKYQADLEALKSGEDNLLALEAASAKALEKYLDLACALSKGRQGSAGELEQAVAQELPDLKLGAAKFIVAHTIDDSRISASGFDQIDFHVQTNPGTSPGPMMKVASGGELSRFLLALKVVLADRGSAPVLIFDEIDTGVGGAVADAIGRRLSRLAKKLQVLSVTHAPQVAARADQHMLIEKQAVENGDFVRTNVRILNEEARNEEVARMLAGAEITDEARAAATRLLSEVH